MYLRQSINIVNSRIDFVFLLAISSVSILTSPLAFLPILMFVFYPIIYGHIVETTMNSPHTSWFNLLKIHWVNYMCVSLVIAFPMVFLTLLCKDSNYIQKKAVLNIIGFLISCLAIYIWPLVFLRRQIKASILIGINIISKNIKVSMPLILLTFVVFAVKFIVSLAMLKLLPLTTSKAFLVGFTQNIVTVYLGLVVFTAATLFIIDQADILQNK